QVALTFLDAGPKITDWAGKYTYLELFAINTILDLIQNSVLSTEQTFQAVQALWRFYNPFHNKEFPGKEVLFRLLREMAQDKTLPVSRRTFAIECISTLADNDDDLPEDMEAKAYSMLLELPLDEMLPLRERVLV